MRYYVGKTLSISQHSALTVLPSARSGNGCKEFHAMKTERLAWGFSHLFDDVTAQSHEEAEVEHRAGDLQIILRANFSRRMI